MRKRTKLAIPTGVAVAGLAVGGIAVAQSGDEMEPGLDALTAQERRSAERAALDATGGGTVNAVERDSEDGATFEVEIARTDGTTVDVRLDESYDVVVIEGDREDPSGDEDE
jgi:uncharacterized membrane protein YkoI